MTTANHREQRAERLAQLSQCGPGTDMGRLLRKFWHPVGLSRELARGDAIPTRILCEDLTLYRGGSGRVHLVGGRCAHRKTLLHTGWVVGDQIRCMYHGWQFDGSGQCTLRPAEKDAGQPEAKIAGYPTHEYAGLIFAYMGVGPAPEFELLRKDAFERSDGLYFARAEKWPCNWFQQVENSLDAVHVSFVHQTGRVGAFGEAISGAVPELEYLETDAGIRQIATRAKNNVRVSDWTFPNANHIIVPGLKPGDPWIDVGHWNTPNDDESTTRFMAYCIPRSKGEADERITEYFGQYSDYNPADHHDDLFLRKKYPEDRLIQLTSAQDYVAAVGQGSLADREDEWLGRSDAGIVLLRRIFAREMESIRTGQATKDWRRLSKPAELPKPVIQQV